jgi:DNA-binding transcriptional regulator LsrR (DeoR family)
MIKALNTPSNSLHKRQSEDKYFYNQFKQTFEGFYKQPQTMKELSVRTGIDRANICRYCKTMRKQKAIAIVTKARCSITKHWANKYTTNPVMFPISSQLKLF